MDFQFSVSLEVMPALLYGARLTLYFALASACLGIVLAILLNLLLLPNSAGLRGFYKLYVSFIRGTPTVILIFLCYYVLPVLRIDLSPAVAGTIALAVNLSAFAAEILRGAIAAVPKGQIEAARSLGLAPLRSFALVVLPQAIIRSIPPLMNEFTFVVKSTPLLSLITVVELMRTGQQIFSTNFRPLEVLLGVAFIFFIINFTFSKLALVAEGAVQKRLGR
jgi:His/Glu/Gln/Arg/opine family amino acid ABC transporter permease subunit